jgi:predicted nuclease with TOPRIM domain
MSQQQGLIINLYCISFPYNISSIHSISPLSIGGSVPVFSDLKQTLQSFVKSYELQMDEVKSAAEKRVADSEEENQSLKKRLLCVEGENQSLKKRLRGLESTLEKIHRLSQTNRSTPTLDHLALNRSFDEVENDVENDDDESNLLKPISEK